MTALDERAERPAAEPGSPPASAPRRLLRHVLRGKEGRHDLEGLRAIAVLGVVVYHLRPSWLPGGFAGVDVFFVLSGFFITGLLVREAERTGTVDLLRFWARRARRLLPASVLVIVVTVVGGYVLTNALEADRVGRDGLVAAVFGMNWRAAYQGTQYLTDPNPSPLVHYWSLGVEEQFYLVWPLVLLALAALARAVRRLPLRTAVLILCLAVAVPSFLLALQQTVPDNSYAYFGTFERAWQLAAGGVLAVTIDRLARLPQPVLVVARYIGIAAVVAFYLGASTTIVYPGRKALVPVLGAALIVAAGEPRWRRRDPLARLLCSTPSQLGGRYSYSWYLWHYPPLVLLPIYLDRPLRIRELAGCAVGTFVLAALTYHLLEDPVRSSRWLARRHGGRSLALGALLIAAALGVSQWTAVAARDAADHSSIADRYGNPLVPQPAVAAAELPRPYSDGCFAAWHAGLAKECRYRPDTGHGDVVLVGDSHAAMWFPAVERMARERNWGLRFWGRNSCPFAAVTKRVDGPYTACDRWRSDVVRRLVAARPSLVIVASLDSVLPPLYAPDAAGRPTRTLVDGTRARRIYQDGMARNLKILQDAGIRTLMIHDTPGYPHAMAAPDCVLAHPHDLAACSLPRKEALPGAPNDLAAAAEVNAADPHGGGLVSTLDATGVFCRAGRCYQVIGSTLAYRDFNHLTAEMVLRLEPALSRAAAAAMRGRVSVVVHRA